MKKKWKQKIYIKMKTKMKLKLYIKKMKTKNIHKKWRAYGCYETTQHKRQSCFVINKSKPHLPVSQIKRNCAMPAGNKG